MGVRSHDLRLAGAIVLAFGLVHGLGLSTRLQDLGLPESGVAIRVILFNVGVEIGQLVALAVMAGVGTLLARRLTNPPRTSRYAFMALAVAGLVAAAVISFPGDDQDSQLASAGDACTEQETDPPPFSAAGSGHPRKNFFGPNETAPIEDLTHVVGDGYVILRYRPDLPARQLKALKQVTIGDGSQYVIAAPDPGQRSPVRAIAARRRLTCTRIDTEAIARFRDDWLASLR